jgi:hypothetical protein
MCGIDVQYVHDRDSLVAPIVSISSFGYFDMKLVSKNTKLRTVIELL